MDKISYINIESTNHCNLDCSFCNRRDVVGNNLLHMSLSNFEMIMSKLKNDGHYLENAKLMGLGEPMLHPKFDKMSGILKSYFPDCNLLVATNCQYKMPPWFEKSLEYIDNMYFSIDGYGERYEKDRAPAKWSKLIDFLNSFREIDRKNTNIVINYVVNPDNIQDIVKIQKYIQEEYKLDGLSLNIAQNWNEDESMVGGYSKEQIEYLKKEFKPYVKGKAIWDYKDCFWVKKGMNIDVFGNVRACNMNSSTTPMGNIFKQELQEIIDSKRYNTIRESCNNNTPTEHCEKCSYKELVPILKEILL